MATLATLLLFFYRSAWKDSQVLFIIFTIPLILILFAFIRWYFLIRMLLQKHWYGAFVTAVQIGIPVMAAKAFSFALFAAAGILGVSTNPPY